LERVHFWKAYWARVSDTHFDTPQKNGKFFSQSGGFCRLKPLVRKASTHLNEIIGFSRFRGGASKKFNLPNFILLLSN